MALGSSDKILIESDSDPAEIPLVSAVIILHI